MTTFSEVLDAASALPLDEQQALLSIIQRRLAEQNRLQLAKDIEEGRADYAAGRARAATVQQIMDEVTGEA